jgi:hypothetical protein
MTDDDDTKVMNGFEVLLDGEHHGYTNSKFYDIKNLKNGTYTTCVRSVYESGTTPSVCEVFEITDGVGIENVKYLFTYYITNSGLLTVKSDAKTVNLEIVSMSGQIVGNSTTNSIVLPQKGVYAVKANIEGNVTNFKVVW